MGKAVYKFNVRSYECGPNGKLTLPSLCNYLQEAASMHACELGFSKSDFDAAGGNISWVLTRMIVKMKRYPGWNDTVSIVTFPRAGRKITACRDFEIKDADGSTLGLASSEWMVINLSTRKITPVPENVFPCLDPALEPVLGAEPFSPKLKFPADVPSRAISFTAQNSHIDINGHVNNVHYVEWMLEPSAHGANPSEIEIVFRSETMDGDEVKVETCDCGGETFHRAFAPDGKDHAVARTVWKIG